MTTSTVFIISGGDGSSGERLARTAIAQFENVDVRVKVCPYIKSTEQLDNVLREASTVNGIVIHTMVESSLRNKLIELALTYHISQIDLIGDLLQQLSLTLGKPPLEQPGLYRKLREQDLKRIEAIEFAIDHDDGKRVHELSQAEIVLVGVSRVGKTPLSVYLSTLGWKVANVPVVQNINPPPELFKINPKQVVGLTIDPGQLIIYRNRRGHHLGMMPLSSYTAPETVAAELEFAQDVFRQGGFPVINMTDRPIEESALEIMNCIRHQ